MWSDPWGSPMYGPSILIGWIFYLAVMGVSIWAVVRYFAFTKAMMEMAEEFSTLSRNVRELQVALKNIQGAIEKTKENPGNN